MSYRALAKATTMDSYSTDGTDQRFSIQVVVFCPECTGVAPVYDSAALPLSSAHLTDAIKTMVKQELDAYLDPPIALEDILLVGV